MRSLKYLPLRPNSVDSMVSGAYGSSEIAEPISMTYSKELGVVGLAKTATQTVALFKLP